MENKSIPAKRGLKVLKALERLEERRTNLINLGHEMVSAYSGSIYPVDLFAIGAIKRSVSMSAGINLLVESFNMICARSLLRMQIDTALRFFAVFLVKEPHDFAMKILGGDQINHIKDSSGKLMSDSYLISKLSTEYPWLPIVYKNLSGYVHFSDHHLFSAFHRIDNETITIQYVIHEIDTKYPESSWVEIVDCFNESTDILIKYLKGWIFTKSNPDFVEKLKTKLTD